MELLASLNSLVHGNFKEAVNYAFLPAGTLADTKRINEGLIAVTQEQGRRGVLTDAQVTDRVNRIAMSGDYKSMFEIPELNSFDQFVEGLNDGKNNIRKTLGGGINFSLGMIPWQVWAVLAVAAAFYLIPILASFAKRK